MADIGALVVKITADASELTNELAKIGEGGKQAARGIENAAIIMRSAFLATASAAIYMTIEASRMAEQTEQLSQKTGISADSLEGMTVAMNRVGLTSQSLAMGMKGLSKEIVDARSGAANSVATFEKMGISMDTIQKGTGATLNAVADAFQRMPDGAEKATLAVELFGRAGLEMIPILNQGSAALENSMKKAQEYGLILSDLQRNQLTGLDDKLDDMKSAYQGFTMQVGAGLSPELTYWVEKVTNGLVWMKNVFNMLTDAWDKLSTRIGGGIAIFELLAKQMALTQVFSLESWKQTIQQIVGINDWVAATAKKIDAAAKERENLAKSAKENLNAADATKKYGEHQKALGEAIVAATKIQLHQLELQGKAQEELGRQIVATTKIMLHQQEIVGAHQQVMGGDIVRATQIENDIKARENKKLWDEILAQDDKAQRERFEGYGNPVDMGPIDPGKVQAGMGRAALYNEQFAQDMADRWNEAYLEKERAMNESVIAEVKADKDLQEYLGRRIVERTQQAQKLGDFWSNTFQNMSDSATYAFSLIRAQLGEVITGMIEGTATMAQFWSAAGHAIIATMVQVAISAAVEAGKTLISNTVAASGSAGVWQAASASIATSLLAIGVAAKALWTEAILPMLVAVGKAIMAFLTAVAKAMSSTIFGIPTGVAIMIGVAAIAATLIALKAIKLREGGIVQQPTLAMIGEAGPEAVIPLKGSRGLNTETGARRLEVPVYLRGREIARAVVEDLPSMWHARGLPA